MIRINTGYEFSFFVSENPKPMHAQGLSGDRVDDFQFGLLYDESFFFGRISDDVVRPCG